MQQRGLPGPSLCDSVFSRQQNLWIAVVWFHAQIKLNFPSAFPLSSVSAKIKAIEAKLKMMAENPDAEYPAAPVYSYFKPSDKKRTTPYSRAAWKSRRWCLWMDNSSKKQCFVFLESSNAFVLCRVRGMRRRSAAGRPRHLGELPSAPRCRAAQRCSEK